MREVLHCFGNHQAETHRSTAERRHGESETSEAVEGSSGPEEHHRQEESGKPDPKDSGRGG
jgi:hypothetical protein